MRSELVFGATAYVSNRYLLTGVASKATRMLHRPNVRLEDTSNSVLRFLGRTNPIAGSRPFTVAVPTDAH